MAELSNEHRLVERARSGDNQAFRAIVEAYEGVVAGTVIGMLGAGDDADDVGQETFIRLYKSLDRFRGDSTLKTYLTRIATNLSLNVLKRRRRDASRNVSYDDVPPVVDPDAIDGERRVIDEERRRTIDRALSALEPEQKAVVVLRMIEGYSTRETAEALGIPSGTVMSRLKRALTKMKPLLEPLKSD